MNGDPSNKKNQFIYTLFYSVLVVLTAQINVHLFTRTLLRQRVLSCLHC